MYNIFFEILESRGIIVVVWSSCWNCHYNRELNSALFKKTLINEDSGFYGEQKLSALFLVQDIVMVIVLLGKLYHGLVENIWLI